MKKAIAMSLVAVSLFAATPAFAKEQGDKHEVLHLGQIKNLFRKSNMDNNQFLVIGSIDSTTTNSLLVKETAVLHVPTVTNGMVVIKTDSKTVVTNEGKTAAMTDLKKDVNVVIMGTVSGSDLTASNIRIVKTVEKLKDHEKDNVVAGKVNANTNGTVTITNGLTSVAKTITTDANTKVVIDGQVKTVADIQVGDSGWVKFKTVGTTLVAKVFHLFR